MGAPTELPWLLPQELDEEGIHGVEAVTEVVELDDGLEIFGGVVDDAAGGEAAVGVVV